MSTGYKIGLFLFFLIAVGGYFVYEGGGNIGFKTGVTENVQFSVIRYDGKVISARLVVDASGHLKSHHHIGEESVGIAYYKESSIISRIQAYDSYRYIVVDHGFTHEVITKEVELR